MGASTWLAEKGPLLVVACGSVLLTLVFFEVGLRILDSGGESGAANPLVDLFVETDAPGVVYEHAPDASVTFPATTSAAGSNPAWHVTTDENGLRRNGAVSEVASELRGICLGDSVMFGIGLNDEDTIPARLGVEVSEKLGRRFECLNFGVSNYTTVQEVNSFRHKDGLAYQPVIVVLGIFTNDFKTELGRIRVDGGGTALIDPDAAGWIGGFWSSLRLADLIGAAGAALTDMLRGLGLKPPASGKPLRPAQTAAVYGALDELRALLAGSAVPLVIVSFPRAWQLGASDRETATERQRAVKEYCDRHGLVCLDLLDDLYGQTIEAYFRPGDDGHPHARAAQRVAEIIADRVADILR